MRIGIDITCILPPRTGIGQSTLALLNELIPASPDDEFVLFVNSNRREPPTLPLFERENVTLRRFILPGPLLHTAWRALGAPAIERFVGRVDVFHSPWGIAPPQKHGRSIITVHDLHCLKHPEQTERWGGQLLAKALPRSAARADHIITVSAQSKREIVDLLGVAEDKITVVHHGVDRDVFRASREPGVVEAVRSEYCLPAGYLLTVATLEPRKNLTGLLDGYAKLKRLMSEPPTLVVAGMDGARADEVRARAAALGIEDDVRFTGYVPDDHLAILYNGALALAQPSLEEGFGMPVLEAMASGVPVAASDIPVFRELFGEACEWFDPLDPEDIAEALRQIISDGHHRESLRAAGRRLAEIMTWKAAAEKTLGVYKLGAILKDSSTKANS